ncbi:MAG: diaminopimelate epimerase [Desulfobacteraceae bacterium]|nr:diaminopimelate epimerase [Desulfobacteraceae bacterium]MBU4002010.1 diaminopimelate epimerase [Pseudomonadota bacterium]
MDESRSIKFWKMSGSGNDFIIIDNRNLSLDVGCLSMFVRQVCRRKVSVGADGLLLVEPSAVADFKWQFYNSDGSMAEMCGNASRCVALFAFENGIAGRTMSFETLAGIIKAEVNGDIVKVRLTDPSALTQNVKIYLEGGEWELDCINTGVPHAVCFVTFIEECDVVEMGRKIRNHETFKPRGTNANFATVMDRNRMRVRTYERGVEDETFACGTGVVASVLAAAGRHFVDSPVEVTVKSGEILRVYFSRENNSFQEVYFEGKVKIIYQGLLFEDAYK